MLKSISKVTSEDLAGVYKEVAETVGVDNAYKIYSHFKGLQLMFPLKFYSKEYIVQQICSEYDGINVHALARKYGYSESRVRQILREQEKPAITKKDTTEERGEIVHETNYEKKMRYR